MKETSHRGEHVIDKQVFYTSGGGSMCERCGAMGLQLEDEPCLQTEEEYRSWQRANEAPTVYSEPDMQRGAS